MLLQKLIYKIQDDSYILTMDLTEEIQAIFNKLKEALPKSKKTEMLLETSCDDIIALICKKNKNIYSDLLYQMQPVRVEELMEKSS